MSNQDDPESKKSKGDLTSLFDLSDFEHADDPEAEAYFENKNLEEQDDDNEDLPNESEGFESAEEEVFPAADLTQTEFNPQAIFDSEDDDSETQIDEQLDDQSDEEFETNFDDFESEIIDELDDKFDALEEDHNEILDNVQLAATIIATDETATHYEKFDDIQKFAKNSHYGPVSAKGEPPFSMIIEDIKYQEDANKILSILKEYGFTNQSNELIISKGLERGSTIISRVSEFAVIFLYTKLSQLPIKLRVGPSDLIFASSSSEHTHQGSVSTDHLMQNREDSKSLTTDDSSSILFSSQSEIQGYTVQEFLGHYFESLVFQAYPEAGDLDQSIDQLEAREVFTQKKDEVVAKLTEKLQSIQANAGIDFEVITQALFTEEKQEYTYQITAKCNAVWIKKS